MKSFFSRPQSSNSCFYSFTGVFRESLYTLHVSNVEVLINFVVTVSFLIVLPIYLPSEWSSILLEGAAGMFIACEVCMHHFSFHFCGMFVLLSL